MRHTAYYRMLTLAVLWLLAAPVSMAAGPAYYSSSVEDVTETCGVGLPPCGNVNRASDAVGKKGVLGSYATLQLPVLNVVGTASAGITLNMSGQVPANYRAGFVIATNGLLSTIGNVTITTYLGNTEQQVVAATGLVTALLGSSAPSRLEFISTAPFDKIKIVAFSSLSIAYSMRVYYAYGVDANKVETARGVVSRFATPTNGTNYSTEVVDNGLTVCVNSGVLNPENAVDQLLTNYATFNTLAGVSCPNNLRVKLEAAVPGGFYAGFVVGKQGLADISALGGLRITTFLNGEPRESITNSSLLSITALSNGQYQISFPTSRAFDEVQLTRSSTLSVLDNLQVYYGFGIEPSAFRDITPVRSDFSNGAGQFAVSADGVLCALCNTNNTNVLNPQNAANSNLNDYAEIRTGLASIATSTALQLNLNNTVGSPAGQAGNAAGVVLNSGAGLLNTQLLGGITIRTYNSAGQLLETASGATLLSQGLLTNGNVEVYFNTTQDFQRVEVEVSNTVALLDRTRVYYAFAEDKLNGFPAIITAPGPLPVELASFNAKAAGQAVDVLWRTASERSNSHFIVERALQAKEGFKAVGRVEGAGTGAGRSYSFRDETAAATGATMLYYRLQQVDNNGTIHYSPVAAVSLSPTKAEVLAVYPNPAASSDAVVVQLLGKGEEAFGTLRIYDMRGVLLRQLPATQSLVNLAGEPLPAGMYNVVLTGGQGQKLGSQRLVVTGR